MDVRLAESISSFSPQASPSDQLITLTYGQLKDLIKQAVAEAIAPLEARIEVLETHQDEHLAALETRQITTQKRVGAISDVQDELCDKINEHATALNTVWKAIKTTPQQIPKGEKTLKRITALEEFLKARGSGATFHEVEKHLDISPSELTRLIAKLDKRRFEIFARAGDNREKVIRLKAQIR